MGGRGGRVISARAWLFTAACTACCTHRHQSHAGRTKRRATRRSTSPSPKLKFGRDSDPSSFSALDDPGQMSLKCGGIRL